DFSLGPCPDRSRPHVMRGNSRKPASRTHAPWGAREGKSSMNKYLFLYWNPPNPGQQPSPEDLQAMFAQWQAWKEKFKKNVVDLGDALHNTGKVLKEGKVTDGPFTEAKEIIGGYSVIAAETYEEALEVGRGCPITLMPGGRIEIRQM